MLGLVVFFLFISSQILSMKKSFITVTAIMAMLLQTTPAIAADLSQPAPSLFENAWQEATASQAYDFTCKISSTTVKTKKGVKLTGDSKKQVDLVVSALKKFKRTTVGTLLGQKNQIYTSRESLNSLGILDSMSAGQITLDEAIQKVKKAKKAKGEIVVDGNFVYYRGSSGWKVFEDATFAQSFYTGAVNDPLTSALEKSSFFFKNYTNSGKAQPAMYQGTLSTEGTTSLIKPFLGETAAKEQAKSPTKLFITEDAHMQKYDVTAKVVTGGLSFTVKEQCTLKFNDAKITVPTGATTIDAESGKKELAELVSSL